MKIAIVHSVYSSRFPSGENAAVNAQTAILKEEFGSVTQLLRMSDEINSTRKIFVAANRVAFGNDMNLSKQLHTLNPDIIHLHNTFPNFGWKWIDTFAHKTVITHHNYRAVCSSSWLTRDDKECTLCLERSSLSAIKHACYRDSRISTLPIAVATRKGIQSPLLNARAAHIFLNQQHLSVMRKYGFEGASTVLPNFLEVPRELPKPANDYLVFAGRTSHEKGYCQLIANFPEGVQLHVFGSGNCFQCELPERSNVVRHGNVASSKLSEYLTKARALILPSQNPEGYPTIVAEALSFGVPIILTERVAISSELVQEGVALTIPNQFTGPDILFAIAALRSDEERMRFKAHKYAIRVYSKNDWIKKIKEIYFGVLNGA